MKDKELSNIVLSIALEFEKIKLIERVVKYFGKTFFVSLNLDRKKSENAIGKELSDLQRKYSKIVKLLEEIYNPEGLSLKEYRDKYDKEELHWQLWGK